MDHGRVVEVEHGIGSHDGQAFEPTGGSRRPWPSLTVIALGAAATPPALVAATRDPLRVLRVR